MTSKEYNESREVFCKYCGKQCKNLNSLNQHEIRCKNNPNRIHINTHSNGFGWKSGRKTTPNKGKIAINKDNRMSYIFENELDKYISLGWKRGVSENFIQKCKLSSTQGIASTPEKEMERKRKISETMKKNPLAGGYRKGSGRGHKGKYKGIYCDSSWELAFLVYCFENNIKVDRCKEKRKYMYENKEHTYLPDFIVNDNEIIEIKGFSTKQWEAKILQNKDITVLYAKDILPLVKRCEDKYGMKFWEVLYDK